MPDNDAFGRDVSGKRQAIADKIEQLAGELINELRASIPDSREKAVAITNFEQALLWAKEAIAKAAIGAD